ncbi:hypothetical protein [Kaarinaea lacus]
MNADISSYKDMPSSIVDAQVQRLLEIVKEYQQQKCDELLDHAHKRSREIIRQAFHNARLRLHHDIQDSRRNMQDELSATRAKQHTFLMQQKHREDQEFLNQAWNILADKLQERWQDSQLRQLWVQNIILTSLKMLPGENWQVACPADWPRIEQDEFIKAVSGSGKRQISFNSSADIVAGIRVSADAAMVDGTLQGLMADRGRIESDMLAQRKEYYTSHEKKSRQ